MTDLMVTELPRTNKYNIKIVRYFLILTPSGI